MDRQYDLRGFAESLDPKRFTALSPGLGLGELRQVTAKRSKPAETAPLVDVARTASPRRLVDEVLSPSSTRPPQQAQRAAPQGSRVASSSSRAALGMERRLMAWAVDFLFVTSSLAVALALATLLAALRAGDDASLLELRPVTWIAAFAPYQILGGVYAVFVAYCILFKLFVGRTFGESLIAPRAGAGATSAA